MAAESQRDGPVLVASHNALLAVKKDMADLAAEISRTAAANRANSHGVAGLSGLTATAAETLSRLSAENIRLSQQYSDLQAHVNVLQADITAVRIALAASARPAAPAIVEETSNTGEGPVNMPSNATTATLLSPSAATSPQPKPPGGSNEQNNLKEPDSKPPVVSEAHVASISSAIVVDPVATETTDAETLAAVSVNTVATPISTVATTSATVSVASDAGAVADKIPVVPIETETGAIASLGTASNDAKESLLKNGGVDTKEQPNSKAQMFRVYKYSGEYANMTTLTPWPEHYPSLLPRDEKLEQVGWPKTAEEHCCIVSIPADDSYMIRWTPNAGNDTPGLKLVSYSPKSQSMVVPLEGDTAVHWTLNAGDTVWLSMCLSAENKYHSKIDGTWSITRCPRFGS